VQIYSALNTRQIFFLKTRNWAEKQLPVNVGKNAELAQQSAALAEN